MLDKRDLQLLLVVRFRRCAAPKTAHPSPYNHVQSIW
jgi:hypothetical protein